MTVDQDLWKVGTKRLSISLGLVCIVWSILQDVIPSRALSRGHQRSLPFRSRNGTTQTDKPLRIALKLRRRKERLKPELRQRSEVSSENARLRTTSGSAASWVLLKLGLEVARPVNNVRHAGRKHVGSLCIQRHAAEFYLVAVTVQTPHEIDALDVSVAPYGA